MRVLPALVLQPTSRAARVLDEAVAVGVRRAVDPGERALDRRPQLAHEGAVAGALGVAAGQHDEQRRGIDAAVVEAERHLAEVGHLAAAHLVQDLAGAGIGLGVLDAALVGGEPAQHALGERGVGPQHLAAR